MNPVDLDPGQYDGTYKLVAGAPALDFANLVSYRGTGRHHDWLEPARNIAVWCDAAGLDVRVEDDVAEVRQFREFVARAFLAVADDEIPLPADVGTIGARAARCWAQRELRFETGAPTAIWVDSTRTLLTHIALGAADLLTSSESLRRIGACLECRWLFLDTSRNRSRRWCDPSDCGNRARQRRHYRRHRRT